MKQSTACWKAMKPVLEISNAEGYSLVENSQSVSVTEDIIGDEVDLLIDETGISFRVNGEAKGEKYKFWKSFLSKKYDLDRARVNFPAPIGVIRLFGYSSGSNEKVIAKVWAACHWDKNLEEARYVPWEMIRDLSVNCGLEPMPQLMVGVPDKGKYKELTHMNILGLPKRGLLLIPTERPVRYIRKRAEVVDGENSGSMIPVKKNNREANKLSVEFASLAIDPKDIAILGFKTVQDGLESILRSKKYMMLEYASRCVNEAGMEEKESLEMLREALSERVRSLMAAR